MKLYSQTLQKHFYILFICILFFCNSLNANDKIVKPPLVEPESSFTEKDSVIQLPISIHADEIESVILRKINTPVVSGITRELIQEKLYKVFKVAFKIRYNVYLEDLRISFEGSKVKIFSSYFLDFSLDYKHDFIPFMSEFNIKGALDGKAYADLHIVGNIEIGENATFKLKISEENITTKFTKVEVPSILHKFDFMKIAKAERYFAEKYLEKSITRRIHIEIEKQIFSKQVDIKLQERIQNLIYTNSTPIKISKDLWLLPKPRKVSLSQVTTINNKESDQLYVNVGVLAHPQLITSTKKPFVKRIKNIPIVIEHFNPKIYLYPAIHIQYKYIEQRIEKGMNSFIDKNYADTSYRVENIKLYPSNKKLVVSIDLIDKDDKEKVLTFYLWGTPHLDTKSKTMQLKDFDYTLASRNVLYYTAKWILDDEIKNLILEKSIFNYSTKFEELAESVSSITKVTPNGILRSKTHSLQVHNLFTSRDSLIITISAKGSMSYSVNLNN